MTNQLHPLHTTTLIRDSYLRYLKTIYPFQDHLMRDQFWQALQQPDVVVKGPLLEASPPFKTGRSIAQLIDDGVLCPGFRQLNSPALPLDRPLYLHQDQAIEKVVRDSRNLIVSTGTGSGKTESFLIPILDSLIREQGRGILGPGVRALLLYPMNALANDQLKRLRRILVNYPYITFGRYTGETREKDSDAEQSFYEQFHGETLLPNELISRTQMRHEPPHLLLTNYAMLEYLLLRPQDNEFFDGPTARHWHFIVLDEAHVYDGASGIEIAMLLRRLKDRVIKSEPNRLRCLATSATLGRGVEDYPEVVKFAGELFGETFVWENGNPAQQDVVEATRVEPAAVGSVWGTGASELYPALQTALDSDHPLTSLSEAAQAHGVPSSVIREANQDIPKDTLVSPDTINLFLYHLLKGDQRLHQLQSALLEAPRFLGELVETLFPEQSNATDLLINLVNLAVRARPIPDVLSLLPARYHVFARAVEGVFACLNTAIHTSETEPRLFLTRHEECPHCHSQVSELATCARCGTAYLVGRIVKETDDDRRYFRHLTNQPDDNQARRAYFVLEQPQLSVDEDEAVANKEDLESVEVKDQNPYILCLRCGAIDVGTKMVDDCGCPADQKRIIYHVDLNGKAELTHCVSCGSRSPAGIVFRFLTGQDAPVSVLATSLYQNLPAADDEAMRMLPGEGRKLLSFADSRQDAAFFASYMERTYHQLLRRRLIIKALLHNDMGRQGHLRLQDLMGFLLREAEAAGQFTQAQSYIERQTLMSTWLMQELIAWDRRISLEGLGIVRFKLVKPDGWSPPVPLLADPWNLSPDEAWHLLELLLDTLRQQGSVTFMEQVDPRTEAFAPRNRPMYMRYEKADPKKGIFGWIPSRGSNRRLDILLKLLAETSTLAEDEQKRVALEALKNIWSQHLTKPGSIWKDHLPTENLRPDGIVHRLSHLFWEVVPVAETNLPAYRCNRCRAISFINVRGVCPAYGCQGRLGPLDTDDPGWWQNHYRYLYLNMIPIPFSAREHTAQWTSNQATHVQEQFVRGELNALSCSTTFELGVDVGELQAVLMRNVPPTTANYVQRAGRAGRRTDSAAFALTYAQRRSHDLTHYSHPERIVAGNIRPPSVVVANEKIVRRHVHSVLLAAFFRWAKENKGQEFRNVGSFFTPEVVGETPAPELLDQFVAGRPTHVQEALLRIVPANMHQELGLTAWDWLPKLLNDDKTGILDFAAREVTDDLAEFARLEQEILAEGGKNKYRQAEYYQRVSNTIRSRPLFGFLGARNVLPKYGFPTDVVELRTSHLPTPEASRVELQRDLKIAIAEYAPGGEVVAGGKIWVSGGLHRQPRRDWPKHHYAVCPECGHFHHSLDQDIQGPCLVCGANLFNWRHLYGTFIVPEFGFIVAEKPKDSGESRPHRYYATQVYFTEYARPDHKTNSGEAGEDFEADAQPDETLSSSRAQIWRKYSRYGKLALVNPGPMGRGYQICTTCGFAQPAPLRQSRKRKRKKPEGHHNPRTGKACKGWLQTYHLGHEFITDVLELNFRGQIVTNPDYNLWRSVLYSLLEGASQSLGIRRDDLDGTLYRRPGGGPFPNIILFDNVPGGAGHVRRIADNLPLTFQYAFDRVNQCECGEETSCYECLRNFRNQFYHEYLQRGLAKDFLDKVLQAANIQLKEA